jgi:hypothetical protein
MGIPKDTMYNKGWLLNMKLEKIEEKLFTLFLTVIAFVFLYNSLQAQNFLAVRVPLLIVVPTLIGLLWQLGKVFIPAWQIWAAKRAQGKKKNDDFVLDADILEESSTEQRKRFLFIGWLISVIVIVYFFGFLYAITIGLLVYFRFLAKLSWIKAIISTAGYFTFIYLFFVVFLQLDLF